MNNPGEEQLTLKTTTRAQLRGIMQRYQADVGACHGADHSHRVVANALQLATESPGIDIDVLEAAAWLHDIGRGVPRKRGASHADRSAQLAVDILPALGFSRQQTQLVCTTIAEHRYTSGVIPASMEGKLLQDADRLDALGAIGIARTFCEGRDRALYHPTAPFPDGRILDDDRFTLDHFFTKLLTLHKTLHTGQAQLLALRRREFLLSFLCEMADELGIPFELSSQ